MAGNEQLRRELTGRLMALEAAARELGEETVARHLQTARRSVVAAAARLESPAVGGGSEAPGSAWPVPATKDPGRGGR